MCGISLIVESVLYKTDERVTLMPEWFSYSPKMWYKEANLIFHKINNTQYLLKLIEA